MKDQSGFEEQAGEQHMTNAGRSASLVLVGQPNVGKSVIFNFLTGLYATVSNYPGTTVEVSRGRLRDLTNPAWVIDTPGVYSLQPITEEEQVTRRILLDEQPDLVVQVADAKNLERALPLTLQLQEAGFRLILVLNMMDELQARGLELDISELQNRLGILILPAVATTEQGLGAVQAAIQQSLAATRRVPPVFATDQPELEKVIDGLADHLPGDLGFTRRALAWMLLPDDAEFEEWLAGKTTPAAWQEISRMLNEVKKSWNQPPEYSMALHWQKMTKIILTDIRHRKTTKKNRWPQTLDHWTLHPLTGIPILLAVLYVGLYKVVGQFGAGVLVDLLDTHLFRNALNPLMTHWVQHLIPWPMLQALFVGEYGMLTLGLRYAIAIILPVVTIFFLVFAVIEDSGYLPRLAFLIDRVFKRMGLSGRAVIPMILGLGCATMATIVTRTLPTRRERLIATFLLALAIPCSAQLGVIMALLQSHPLVLVLWAAIMLMILVTVGMLTARLLPGEAPSFYMEVPPLRLPRLKNILIKTYARVEWYLKEVIPIFILVSGLIWAGQQLHVFEWLLRGLAVPVGLLGLPAPAASAFLFGFFRRDYGAAGLYDLHQQGLLDINQLLVASVALTLFLPCVAQFIVNIKERGWRAGLSIAGLTLVMAFGVAWLLHTALTLGRWQL